MPEFDARPITDIEPERIKRFYESLVITEEGCWIWIGPTTGNGYGQFVIRSGDRRKHGERTRLAHRVSYALYYGVDPLDKCVCHVCDNAICVRPSHLFLGTIGDNNTDRHRKGRTNLTTKRARGDKNANAKLNDEKVAEIRRTYDGKFGSKSRMARQYGVSHQTIRAILNNEYWHHVS